MYHLYYAVLLASLFVHCQCDAGTNDITQCEVKCDEKEKASTLLDIATDYLNKSKSFFPDCDGDDLNCGKCEKSLAFLEVASNLMPKTKKNLPTCPEPVCPTQTYPEPTCPTIECPVVECPIIECPEITCPITECLTESPPPALTTLEPQIKYIDCSEILQSGKKESGVYTIWPRSVFASNKPVSVYCDMNTDGGGWTVIQRRGQYSTPKEYFYKDWQSYKNGFGNVNKEFWLGNENIHAISSQGIYSIRFDLVDASGEAANAHYSNFRIDNENSAYTLHISGYSGNAGDPMQYNNNMKFSTKDRDNDQWGSSCTEYYQGAWWYTGCGYSHLNSLNQPGVYDHKGMHWYQFKQYYSLGRIEIKLRKR